jgi:ABC-type dipeptide/oligopeptide/nickel transport system permease subunit
MKIQWRDDIAWTAVWIGGLVLVWIWNSAYLNAPAFALLQTAFVNSVAAGLIVVLFALAFGWAAALSFYFLSQRPSLALHSTLRFVIDLVRSVPQIVGMLTGYIVLTLLIDEGAITSQAGQILWTSFVISIFVFVEVADMITERIHHYASSDFVPAMLACGISEWRILNVEILWRNCRGHLLNKTVAVFGMAIFLQCSVDFVVSVGLSNDVNLTNIPVTLGSLLAKLDSKQDILALGIVFSDPSYLPNLFVRHLQGLSTAWIIVFTLLCVARMAEGIAKRYRL